MESLGGICQAGGDPQTRIMEQTPGRETARYLLVGFLILQSIFTFNHFRITPNTKTTDSAEWLVPKSTSDHHHNSRERNSLLRQPLHESLNQLPLPLPTLLSRDLFFRLSLFLSN